MATLIKTDGTKQTVYPSNKKGFTYDELIKLIGGSCEDVEFFSFYDDSCMCIDEMGKFNGQSLNREASRVFLRNLGTYDAIMGNAILLTEKECNKIH